jgi:hypothetical protein
MKLKFFIPLLLGILFSANVKAQDVAIKTNLLYDATATVNLGVEVGLAPKWTLDISGNINAWNVKEDARWRHWLAQPEARYWFCDRFSRHFIGFHAIGGQYNVGGIENNISFLGSDFSNLSEKRYQGWAAGAGIAYGYAFILGKHWNLELELGVGYAYMEYDVYDWKTDQKLQSDAHHNYVGITKLNVGLSYLF